MKNYGDRGGCYDTLREKTASLRNCKFPSYPKQILKFNGNNSTNLSYVILLFKRFIFSEEKIH